MKNLVTIAIILLLSGRAICQSKDTVQVFPGKGILLNGDSILLGDTSYIELANKLGVESPPLIFEWYVINCRDDDYSQSGPSHRREIKYDSITFTYFSCGDTINMHLGVIEIDESEKLYSFYTEEIFIGGPDSLVEKSFYPKGKEIKEANKMWTIELNSTDRMIKTDMFTGYYFYTKGVTFDAFNRIVGISIFNRK